MRMANFKCKQIWVATTLCGPLLYICTSASQWTLNCSKPCFLGKFLVSVAYKHAANACLMGFLRTYFKAIRITLGSLQKCVYMGL